MKLHALLATLTASASVFAGPIQNANFETALGTEWTVKNSIPSGATTSPTPTFARVAGTRTGGSGAWVLETAGRDHVQDGPLQGTVAGNPATATLKNTLASASYGNDRTYTTRVWVKTDATASDVSVRCLLRWRDNGAPQVPLILAEAVILQPGVWTLVTGTAKLHWVTLLTAATLDFDLEQIHKGSSLTPPPQWFRAFQLDDLQMELDGDGDGLWDSEESSDHTQAIFSFSDDADSDDDRMPDDWEKAHRANPTDSSDTRFLHPRDASDATLDFDSDGFTNV